MAQASIDLRGELAARREALMQRMGAGSVAVIAAAPERVRSRDSHYPYHQDRDFLYLTGFPEPEAVAVLVPGAQQPFVLFVRDRDPLQETWNGRRAGPLGAMADYDASVAYPLAEIDERLPALLENRERLHYAIGYDGEFDARLLGWLNRVRAKVRGGVTAPAEIVAVEQLVHDMRLIKSPAELELMREAARISVAAHVRAMRNCRPGLHEYTLEAEIQHEFRRHGATSAYNAIVAGGENACILHYTENDQPLADGDLLLIDAGAEYCGYAGDITRTFPVGGRYSDAQRAIYELVLAAQLAAIAEVRPGATWDAPHQAAVRTLTEGLIGLGLLQGSVEERIEDEGYKAFYMHRTGHWLGLDVHDVGDYKVDGAWRRLEPGMVLTVEPGLYIASGTEGVEPRWWGIGVRIEDDVAVTADGHEVLTAGVPKTVEAIEALMATDAA